MLNLDYGKTYGGLNFWAACVVFFKKGGELRVMLASRSRAIAAIAGCADKVGQLNHRDSRCNIHNKNIGAIDLLLGEVRAFNTERVAWFEWVNVRTPEELDQAILRAKQLEEQYKGKLKELETMDGMDEGLDGFEPDNSLSGALAGLPDGSPM